MCSALQTALLHLLLCYSIIGTVFDCNYLIFHLPHLTGKSIRIEIIMSLLVPFWFPVLWETKYVFVEWIYQWACSLWCYFLNTFLDEGFSNSSLIELGIFLQNLKFFLKNIDLNLYTMSMMVQNWFLERTHYSGIIHMTRFLTTLIICIFTGIIILHLKSLIIQVIMFCLIKLIIITITYK